ncbi:MAG: signal transduction histidine kinase [Sulfitobacter sp.]|jgi:signal transduction histidine kinase
MRLFGTCKKYVASKAYIIFTVIVLGSVAGIGYSIIKLDRDNYISTLRHDVEQALYATTDQIQLRFFEAVLVAKNIENILAVSEQPDEKQIARIVDDLQRHNPSVIAVALAPNLTVSHSFPQTGNGKSIGLNYWEVPAQMASIAQAYRRQSPVVDGPVSLVQGGAGYILRYPVFLPNPELNIDQFWGVISIVVKAEGLLSPQLHSFGGADNYMFTLRELQASGLAAPRLAEDALYQGQPVVTEFYMLGSRWQAAARPENGWPSYSPQSPFLVAFALILAVVLVVVLGVVRSLALKKENARALLAEAIGCINEGFIAFDDKERLMVVNQKYLDYHPEIADLFVQGKTMEELLRLSEPQAQSPEENAQRETWIAERLARFRNPGESFLQNIGDDRWLKVTEAKTPHGYTVAIWTDITVEKRALEAAETADREKTEFLNNVSHELRTPLTVISGRASFLRNSEKVPQSKRIQTVLEAEPMAQGGIITAVADFQQFVSVQAGGISDSAQHMLRLVEDLLDWTKVARGQLELNMDRLQVGEIAESVVLDLQPEAEAKGLSLSYSGDGAAQASADRIRLKQILYNLISNAIKFTDVGSIHLSMTHEKDWVVFDVKDTGRGISEENLERVFERFKQVDGSMTRQNGGLGLGLAISEQLATLHGGTLSLESTFGQGSTFRLRLPRIDPVVVPFQKIA